MGSIVSKPTVCLSFDLEEHFQVVAFDSPMRRRHWERFESRIDQNTDRILSLLAQYRARATFFVLGWLAERHGAVIQRIAKEGHEVASHGYANEMVTAQAPRQFREDVRKTKIILEDLTGKPVVGYRAPNLTLTDDVLWALPILVEEGYRYTSSIVACRAQGNGVSRLKEGPQQIFTASGPLWTLPPRIIRIGWTSLPLSGGVYFRLTPYSMFRRSILSERVAHPVVLYFRAWELDPKQPRMNGRALARFGHYCNLKKVGTRLRLLLREFACGPLSEAIKLKEVRPAQEFAVPASR
jgi:polysaccharide deacetylase family protein (PEP-CTERM system associated)